MKNNNLKILGFLLLGLWVLTLFEEFPYFGSFNFLWFCKISFLLLGLACLTRDSRYLLTFFAVGIIPEIIWTVDFFSIAVGHKIIGTTSFMFEYGESPWQFTLNLLHLFLLPAAFFISRNIKLDKSARKSIIIAGVLVIVASYFFSGSNIDINCVHNLCYPKPLNLGYASAFFVVLYILICAFFIEKIFRKKLPRINKKSSNYIILILILIGIVGGILGYIAYNNSPHYTCISNEKVICERFFMDRVKDKPYLQFSTKVSEKDCKIDWLIDGEHYYQILDKNGSFISHAALYLPKFEEGNRKITSFVSCN